MIQWFRSVASQPGKALILVLVFAVLTHLPSGLGSLLADDYMQWAMLEGSQTLHQMGFSKADPDKNFIEKLQDGFRFFSPDDTTSETYREYGNLPWWAAEQAAMVPFRPLATISHWLDYQLFANQLFFHKCHSLFYIVLLAWAALRFYRHLGQTQVVALLAVLLLLADFSLSKSYSWLIARNSYMALAFGFLSIHWFVQWREQSRWYYCLASLVMLIVALLSAEAAVSAVAYMGAYVLCLEKHRALVHKIPPLLPFIAVILLWRIGYSAGGFGAHDIGLYVDPVRSPLAFMGNFLLVFPLLFLSQIIGLDSLVILLQPESQGWVSLAGWLLMLLSFYLLWPLLKSNAVSRFMLVAMLVAALPGIALITGEGRALTFPAIGGFFLLAQLILYYAQASASRVKRVVVWLLLTWQLILPAILAVVLSVFWDFSNPKQYENIEQTLAAKQQNSQKTSLVIINDAAALFYYLPFQWAYYDFLLPDNINVLTPGLNSFTLTRFSSREFRLDIPNGLAINHRASLKDQSKTGQPNAETPLISSIYSGLYALSFFNSPANYPRQGSLIHNADMELTIVASNSNGPTKINLRFVGEISPDDKIWQYFDWQTKQYQQIQPLKVGDTLKVRGPFE